MFELLIALGLFGGLVWVIALAIFMIMRNERGADTSYQPRDTIASFVEENYGSHFMAESALGEASLRKL